ncbi:MAG: M1 family aminopeptidase [Psychroserpens sp.]
MLKKIIFVTIIALNSFAFFAQNLKQYDGSISIDMNSKNLIADFKITLHDLSKIDTLKLYLHQSSKISEVYSNSKPIPYKVIQESFIGDDKYISLPTADIKENTVGLQYSLSLDSLKNNGFTFNENWLELNLYTAWFPFNTKYGTFAYNVDVNLTEGYNIISSGKVSNSHNLWKISQQIPSVGIPIIILPQLNHESIGNGKVKIYHFGLDQESVNTIKGNTIFHFENLNGMFSNSNSNNLVLTVNKLDHTTSYARKNFISLSIDGSFDSFYDKILAHELAHLWWNNASVNTWEDWLNESFAEYSAIILQRDLYGEDNFTKNIVRLKKQTKDLPTLYQIEKSNNDYQNVITYKGAFILYGLEFKIGRVAFVDLLKVVYKNKITSTSELLNTIEKELGKEIKDFVIRKLKGIN